MTDVEMVRSALEQIAGNEWTCYAHTGDVHEGCAVSMAREALAALSRLEARQSPGEPGEVKGGDAPCPQVETVIPTLCASNAAPGSGTPGSQPTPPVECPPCGKCEVLHKNAGNSIGMLCDSLDSVIAERDSLRDQVKRLRRGLRPFVEYIVARHELFGTESRASWPEMYVAGRQDIVRADWERIIALWAEHEEPEGRTEQL